jgi:hypothetical protein
MCLFRARFVLKEGLVNVENVYVSLDLKANIAKNPPKGTCQLVKS